MSGKGLDGLPAGLGSDGCSAGNMLRFLESTLAELDAAAGCVDDEAHRQLDALRQKTSRLESGVMDTSQQPEAMQQFSEAEIAHELDKLESRLAAMEHKLADADEDTKHLLGTGAQLWMGLATPPGNRAPETVESQAPLSK